MTKHPKRIALILAIAAVYLGGFLLYQSQFAEIGQTRYKKTIESIDLSGAPVTDLNVLQAFPNLKLIDLRGTGLTRAQFDTLKSRFPEARILWDIPFQGDYWDMDTSQLTLTTLTEEDLAVIPYFTQLRSVSTEDWADYENFHTLCQQRPDLNVTYCVPVAGTSYPADASALTLPGGDTAALSAALPYFTKLETLKLTPPLAPIAQLLSLRDAFPGITFSWTLDLAGIPVDTRTETLDLTGIPLTVEQMDAVLPYLLNLSYVDMTDCGISNEEMEALNNRYEDIKIVWTVSLGRFLRVKTDITTFMPSREGVRVGDSDLYNLRYCHDVIALDIGHMNVSSCEFAAYMPKLKYLLMADTGIQDLTPLTGLTELVYLELFLTYVTDCDALLTLTSLEDLNICYTRCDREVIAQMTWLKNLWWTNADWLSKDLVTKSLVNTNLVFNSPSSTGKGWRELPNYYAQRDAFGLYYMTG